MRERRTIMKIQATAALGLALAFAVTATAAVTPGSGIKHTSHDLSLSGLSAFYFEGTPDNLDRLCIYCHAPHNAIDYANDPIGFARLSYSPLWNHEVTLTQFTMYSNGTSYWGTVHDHSLYLEPLAEPGGPSLLCLSCHDGSIAISAYGFIPSKGLRNSESAKASGRILIGGGAGGLRNHHPIGFDYEDVASVNSEIYPSDTPLLGNNVYGLRIYDLLWNGRMECTTCHDVHNTQNEGSKFTWVMDRGSNLCLTCHRK